MGCSGEQKVTKMALEVDLQCCQCYKMVKRLLCKFPQIRDQVYDVKNNKVIITVVCCSPERIRDKLCCKGGKSIKTIEILHPEKPPKVDKPNQTSPASVPAPPAEKPNPEAPPPAEKQKAPEKIQKNGSKNGSKNCCKNGSKNGPKCEPAPRSPEPKPVEEPAPPKQTAPAPAPAPAPSPKAAPGPPPRKPAKPEAQWVPECLPGPPPQPYPLGVCCGHCYEGMPGGPCYQGGYGPGNYGYPYWRPPYQAGYYPSGCRCDYFSEENPSACSIM